MRGYVGCFGIGDSRSFRFPGSFIVMCGYDEVAPGRPFKMKFLWDIETYPVSIKGFKEDVVEGRAEVIEIADGLGTEIMLAASERERQRFLGYCLAPHLEGIV